MALRVRNIAILGSLALLAAFALGLAGPRISTASANACHRYGNTMPLQLTHSQARRAVRCLLNRAREHRGLSHLGKDRRLHDAAQAHTNYMIRHRCFSHECPGEASLLSRLEGVNYIIGGLLRWTYGENIAWGGKDLGTPKAMFHAWMHSPEHKHNILDADFRDVGIGFAKGMPPDPNGNGGTYTTDFGMRKG